MPNTSDTYDGRCPGCGQRFNLADLRRMAVGDGVQRWLWVSNSEGRAEVVSFDDYNPATMVALNTTER